MDTSSDNGGSEGNASGSDNRSGPAGASNGSERNKRARSTSSSISSHSSLTSLSSSPYATAESNSSTSISAGELSAPLVNISHGRPIPTTQNSPAALSSSHYSRQTLSEPRHEVLASDPSSLSSDIPRPLPSPARLPPLTTEEGFRQRMERYNEFDEHISALRRSHSPSSPSVLTPPPTLPPITSLSVHDDEVIPDPLSQLAWFSPSGLTTEVSQRIRREDAASSDNETLDSSSGSGADSMEFIDVEHGVSHSPTASNISGR